MLAQANILGLTRAARTTSFARGPADAQAAADRRWIDLVPTLAVIALGVAVLAAVPTGLAWVAYRSIRTLLG